MSSFDQSDQNIQGSQYNAGGDIYIGGEKRVICSNCQKGVPQNEAYHLCSVCETNALCSTCYENSPFKTCADCNAQALISAKKLARDALNFLTEKRYTCQQCGRTVRESKYDHKLQCCDDFACRYNAMFGE